MGPHLMAYHRTEMDRASVIPAADLRAMPDGIYTSIAGVPPENLANMDFLETETLKPGSSSITRSEPGPP